MPDAARLSDDSPTGAARQRDDHRPAAAADIARDAETARPAEPAADGLRPEDGSVPATSLLERLSTGAALIDHDGVVRWCNRAFAELRGTQSSAIVGLSITALHEPGDNPYATADALRLDREPGAEYRFDRQVGGRALHHVLRVVAPNPGEPARTGERRWFVLETVPATPATTAIVDGASTATVRPGPFPEAVIDRGGRTAVANDGFGRLVGELAHRLPGRSLLDLVATPDAEALCEAMRDAADAADAAGTGGAGHDDATVVEVHLTRNDARPSWAELALSPASTGLLAVRARDVTDRKRDELLLAEVFDASPAAYALIGADGAVHSTNPAWRRTFGTQQPHGTLLELVVAEDRDRLAGALSASVEHGAGSFETTVLIDDGDRHPFLARVRATPLHDLSHRTERLLVAIDDLTEHALEVETARRSAALARATLDDVDLAVTVHDADGEVRELNLGAHRLFGADATELPGHTALPARWQPQLPDGTPLDPADHPVQRVLAGGAPAAEAVVGLRIGNAAHGEPRRWFLVRARALSDDSLRHRIGAVATYVDISAMQREVLAARSERVSLLDAFEALPVPAYQTGRDVVPVRASAALLRLVDQLIAATEDIPTDNIPTDNIPAGPPSPSSATTHRRDGDDDDQVELVVDLTRDPPAAFDRTRRADRVRPPAERSPGDASRPGPPPSVADLFSLIHRDDRRTAADALAEAARQRSTVRFQHRLNADGAVQWVDHQITPLDTDGELDGFIGVLIPVPDWVAQGDRTRRLVRLVETANELVGEFELDSGRVTYLNPRAQQTFAVADHQLDRLHLTDLYAPDSEQLFRNRIWPALLEHSQWDGELPMRTLAGETLHVQQWITAEWDDHDRIVRLVAVGHDVTDRSRREAELAERASHDSLTGLPNRARLLEAMDAALARARRSQRLAAVAFLDLDRFKLVNDRFGHDAGDQLLVQVAERLRSVVRPSDLVARLGGDEFVVLCDSVEDRSQALAMAHRVSAALGSSPYPVAGATVRITASVGLTLSHGAEHPEALLRDADAALYRAKDRGRARIEVFDETMRSRVGNRELLAEELRTALGSGAVAVLYQPCIDLRTGNVLAVEASASWEHATRGPLQAGDFAEEADSAGLLAQLGEQVLREATTRARAWQHRFGTDAPSIHVKVAHRQVVDSALVDSVATVLRASGLRPSLLCLELSEAVLLEDSDQAIGTVRDLKALGVRLAIDDFGTGYSSLSYLSRLPVDVVKIDRSFVEELNAERPASAVVAAPIISLARTLELSSIAEGVASVGQLARLRELGCDAAQGPYFSPPLGADTIDAYLAERLQRTRRREGAGGTDGASMVDRTAGGTTTP
ncbi:MAG: EAL domain-containing protein [Acidimicrobiales bacterium]|nr:EAL domain-containing protein [Acidimicrobiales bacterium]